MILYLHGFKSSPSSSKAQLVKEAMTAKGLAQEFHAPQLPPSPREAIDLCLDIVEQHKKSADLTIFGSSLGGYYATYLAEKLKSRAVLINPAIFAARDLSTQIGPSHYYHNDEPFVFTTAHVKELAQLQTTSIEASRYLLLAGMADEVLDWQEMSHKYRGAKQIIVPGENHSFQSFEDYLPEALKFALNQ